MFDYWENVAKFPDSTTVTGDMTLIAHFKPKPILSFQSADTSMGTVSV